MTEEQTKVMLILKYGSLDDAFIHYLDLDAKQDFTDDENKILFAMLEYYADGPHPS